MASKYEYICKFCGYKVSAWDEGHPYVEYLPGCRRHFYHPSKIQKEMDVWLQKVVYDPEKMTYEEMKRKHTGNEIEHLCRQCGKEYLYDDEKDLMKCKGCGGGPLEKILSLGGKKCIKCDGTFEESATMIMS